MKSEFVLPPVHKTRNARMSVAVLLLLAGIGQVTCVKLEAFDWGWKDGEWSLGHLKDQTVLAASKWTGQGSRAADSEVLDSSVEFAASQDGVPLPDNRPIGIFGKMLVHLHNLFAPAQPADLDEITEALNQLVKNYLNDPTLPHSQSLLYIAEDLKNGNKYLPDFLSLGAAVHSVGAEQQDDEEIKSFSAALLQERVASTGRTLEEEYAAVRRSASGATLQYIPKLVRVVVSGDRGSFVAMHQVDRAKFSEALKRRASQSNDESQFAGVSALLEKETVFKATIRENMSFCDFVISDMYFSLAYRDLMDLEMTLDLPPGTKCKSGDVGTSTSTDSALLEKTGDISGLIGDLKTRVCALLKVEGGAGPNRKLKPEYALRLHRLESLLDVATDLYLHKKFYMSSGRLRTAANAVYAVPSIGAITKFKTDLLRSKVAGTGLTLARHASNFIIRSISKTRKYRPIAVRVIDQDFVISKGVVIHFVCGKKDVASQFYKKSIAELITHLSSGLRPGLTKKWEIQIGKQTFAEDGDPDSLQNILEDVMTEEDVSEVIATEKKPAPMGKGEVKK